MALPLYLAMTAAEIEGSPALPARMAYMACHFSAYGDGLSNCPKSLPEGSLLILNDRTPICGHAPAQITAQLEEILELNACWGILLDFQRPDVAETAVLAKYLVHALSCPVGVSAVYGRDLDCPIFLPPVPPDTQPETYLSPWRGREIWLEAALDGLEITLTEAGASTSALPFCEATENAHRDEMLHCHYHAQVSTAEARFTLCRTREDLDELLEEAESLGVAAAVGLWQELN